MIEPSRIGAALLRTRVLTLKNGLLTGRVARLQVSPPSVECMTLMALPAHPPTDTLTKKCHNLP